MKKIFLVIIAWINLISLVKAQKYNNDQIDSNIQKLIEFKVNYEKFRGNKKGDSIFRLYESQVNKIKESPKIYLKHIKISLKKNDAKLVTESIAYKYPSVVELNISLQRHLIKKIDLYRVVRYSLFKRKDSLLPTDFRGLSVVDEKNYNGYDKNKEGEYKIALKFLLDELSLTRQEIKFIKNCDNQVYVLDMKKYLNTNGITSNNNEFIKWAIDYLTKYPGLSIAYLDNSYEPIRSKNYVPKDKDSINH